LRHVEGLWAGHPFLLEPWQHDIVWNVFGWKREDGRRRYTTVYVEIPRKNGKSTFGAGLALKLLTADNEFVLITSLDDPLSRRRSVRLPELADRAWLMREPGSGTRAFNEEFLARHEITPQLLTLGSNGAIKQAVRAGIGVSLQSRVAVELELASGVVTSIRLRERLPVRRWYVLRSAIGPVRRPVEDFIAFLTSEPGERALHDRRPPSQRAVDSRDV